MRKYDVVIPKCGVMLYSGAEAYTHAVVLSVSPFVLVSEGSDMRWSHTVSPDDFVVVGRAAWGTRFRIQRRRKS